MKKKKLSIFVAGTDTGCGKTHVACALASVFAGSGRRVAVCKPFVSGAVRDGVCQNFYHDVEALKFFSKTGQPFDQIAAYAFEQPVSPYSASMASGKRIDIRKVVRLHENLRARYDVLVSEGIGGLFTPLKKDFYVIDLMKLLSAQVFLVTANRLGAINITIMSMNLLGHSGIRPKALMLNDSEPAPQTLRDSNENVLKRLVRGPKLVRLAHDQKSSLEHFHIGRSTLETVEQLVRESF